MPQNRSTQYNVPSGATVSGEAAVDAVGVVAGEAARGIALAQHSCNVGVRRRLTGRERSDGPCDGACLHFLLKDGLSRPSISQMHC